MQQSSHNKDVTVFRNCYEAFRIRTYKKKYFMTSTIEGQLGKILPRFRRKTVMYSDSVNNTVKYLLELCHGESSLITSIYRHLR